MKHKYKKGDKVIVKEDPHGLYEITFVNPNPKVKKPYILRHHSFTGWTQWDYSEKEIKCKTNW